ncbi:Small-conductance mechanosensitive channel [Tranquillimonas rosea]|uniref:Small-conductance mechanosensitive channel n=1 Tax=Tranquillimonas rosea TaxID=641238 RepID=A0A1H9TAZ2_9RHOB|nr:DUF3772 domain-containing protein [Tranquillimonas rosea]SER94425.1 Small-conductance mechanosensitive channel [Tranquillimonas rosea]
MVRLTSLFGALALVLALALSAAAQPVRPPDYSQFDTVASNAEQMLQRGQATNDALTQLRDRLVSWRDELLTAQSINQTRVDSVRNQLNALGPPPGEDETEPEATAEQRETLNEQLETLLAPRRRAEAAYSRADSLIGEIDALLRARQAEQLMELGPSPLNPVLWVDAVGATAETGRSIAKESIAGWEQLGGDEFARRDLPIALVYFVISLFLLVRGRYRTEQLTDYLWRRISGQSRDVLWFVISLGQILLPYAGIQLLVAAIQRLSLVGQQGNALLGTLPEIVLTVFAARWLGSHVFPREPDADTPLNAPGTMQYQGRVLSAGLGVILGLNLLVTEIGDLSAFAAGEEAVLSLPLILVSGLVFQRLGQILLTDAAYRRSEEEDSISVRAQVTALLGRVVQVVGVFAPLMAAIGYINLAQYIIYPSMLSLALIGFLAVLSPLVRDTYALIRRASTEEADQALIPVLLNLALTLAAIPVFALIWGARKTDILEVWAQFRSGFSIGDTRVSPTDFLVFFVVFAIGLIMTRLLQGTMRSTVLPRTKMDAGGRNAIVSGLGYIGIFLAVVLAVTSAGIDLSSLAIVAGALSVGIGFGLQTIVSNFVSGIILLIERPISEGDWIEVGGRMGIVKDISVRSTRIETFDRTDVIVPNADFVSGTVTNWTRGNLVGRVTLKIGVAYNSDTRHVERILMEVCEAHPLVAIDPPPAAYFLNYGEHALEFTCYCMLRDVNYILVVQSELNHQIRERFREEGIEIPLPQRDVWLRNPETLQQPKVPDGAPEPDERPERPQPATRDAEAIDHAQGEDV